ncbi:unnamed protein product [marine sediment metagenome]|uniref:Four helix bundle protein n=1 Tax=marine sediment metagenome TaxID=412755 RepID=X1L5Z1_9ZZZZ
MNIKDYKDLLAYQKSYQVALLIYKVTSGFPSTEIYGLVSQMRRAAISVPSNISEGYRRGSQKEYAQFLKISLGSNSELETQLSLSRDLGFINGDEFKKVYELNEEVGRLLSSYVKKLEGSG